jgi:hypothetical protein
VCRYIFALPVKQDLDRPPTIAASGLLQLQLDRLDVVDKLGELVRQPLDGEGALVDVEDELEGGRLLRR